MPNMNMRPMLIRLPYNLESRLEAEARRQYGSKASVIRKALDYYLYEREKRLKQSPRRGRPMCLPE